MPALEFDEENKRIATADSSGVAHIPTEDNENERITLTSGVTPTKLVFETTGDGYYTIKDQVIEEEYLDPNTLNLTVDEDGYSSIPE